jgi:hypothetical protein
MAILATGAVCTVGPLFADDLDGQYEPGRAVARISILNGDVSVRRGDSGDVVAAAINAPLMADDRLLTSSSSRAEVQLDHSNIVRIGPNSEVRFVGLDLKNSQLQIAAGTVTLRVLRPGQMQVELDTPSVAVRPLRDGAYRIMLRDDGSSEITVRAGEAEIDSQRGSERLEAGRTMNARGPASDPEFQVVAAIPPDNWDRWNDDRDRYLTRSRSYQYVSPDVYGAEDLDQNGRWVNDPSYGQVWAPSVAPGWAPYQNGRWVWEDYYGWTWVSADPWGWAPYHYGRWFWGPVGWCWYPGPIFAHPFWAPAYVGFFGWGGGFGVGVGFGFGNIGWVALAPFETFHPWWGRGFYGGFRNGGFVNNTTIINNTNITNVYRNARVNGGVTGVSAGEFGRGRQFASFNGSQIQQAGLVHGVLPVSPDRSSLRLSDRVASGSLPQSRAQSFASHAQAARVDHVGFEQQQRGMQQLRSNLSEAGRGSVLPQSGSGWRTMGDRPSNVAGGNAGAIRSSGSAAARGQGETATHGWNRFGEPIHGTTSTPQLERNYAPQMGGANNGFAPYRGGSGNAVRISPPIVGQRAPSFNSAPSYQAPRSYSPSYQAPRNYSPSYQAPRSYSPSYQAPRSFSPSYSAPRGSSPSYSAPRGSSPSYSAPRSFSPSYSAPRNSGSSGGGSRGGGGHSGGGHSGGGGHEGGGRR